MNPILQYLNTYRRKGGLYFIKPKDKEILQQICLKTGYTYTSEIAYIGKAEVTKTSDLFCRAKQEMGWSNFEGATFVKKIGLFLDFDVKDKKNKELREKTKSFIHSNFNIECIVFDENTNIQLIETEYIKKLKPCLNNKKR
ncbi:hypothetical protein SAMN05192550_1122 [Flavobacterium glycines]|uniref:GIY-YIG catalytic domain-containing protein n=1 Tax=Flavobacterium glycines TaxID=551990 RepID=A0A1B9DRS2_9FLAO|nr:hypothetical protein [Flavobacterium glycines]OCB72386.1 hypothetical protein FBGL_06965 [Flavobacterium glycines]GEL09861.1 hypothetical protein FGL01_06000 [Flavobacterium glycines]SDI90784.1 hypothetical protein SAMN05192550_1122 [Flavobacterium glycines]